MLSPVVLSPPTNNCVVVDILLLAPRKLHVVDHVIICKTCVTRIILGFIDHGTGSLIMVRVH